jgi:hypothetical protein
LKFIFGGTLGAALHVRVLHQGFLVVSFVVMELLLATLLVSASNQALFYSCITINYSDIDTFTIKDLNFRRYAKRVRPYHRYAGVRLDQEPLRYARPSWILSIRSGINRGRDHSITGGRLRGADFVAVREGPRVLTLIAKLTWLHAKVLKPTSNMAKVDSPLSGNSCLSWGLS